MAVGGSGSAAGSIRAGKAHVEMSAKDAGLNKALDGLERRMKAVAKVAAGLALALVAAIGAGVIGSFKSAVDHMDKMKKAADRLGTTTDKISALGYAAEQSGASFEEMENAAKFLNKNLELNADAFAQFGLDAKQLKTLGLDEQMIAISDAISAMSDPSERTAAAMTLLGKSGDRLLPLFKDGGKGLRSLLHEAKEVGAVIDPTKAAQAERIGDAISRAWTSMVSMFREIGTSFFGGVDNLEVASKAVSLTAALVRDELIPAAREFVRDLLPEMGEGFAETWAGIKNAIQGGDIKLAMAIGFKSLEVEWAELTLGMTGLWNEFKASIVDGWHEAITELKVLLVDYMRWWQKTLKDNIPQEVLDRAREAGLINGLADAKLPSERQIRRGARDDARDRHKARLKDEAEAMEDLVRLQKELNALMQAAASLNATNPVLANAIMLGQLAIKSGLQAAARGGVGTGSELVQGQFGGANAGARLGGMHRAKELATLEAMDAKLGKIEKKVGGIIAA